ncbi:hypothetical protein PQX77_003744 [Marasmius sp. AFHP31]|nr:hypothetical protein PQX77_003744 [Marasmius sp. AFHP31]
MPASRTRRRSSTLNPPQPTKPGVYGVPSIPHRLTFCENVTPGTYTSSLDSPSSLDGSEQASLDVSETLFPPAEVPSQPSRRRQPPGKRRSQGYIPRPPNAFMLFRADFVRQKHVPGTIEANHGSLSRIIGNCWRSLPAQDKRVWEVRAKHAKELHKKEFPNYKFKPIHTKKKKNVIDSSSATPANADGSLTSKVKLTISTSGSKPRSKLTVEEEEAAIQARNEYLTQLLLLGHKNESLAAEMAKYDEQEKARREAMLANSPQSEGVEERVEGDEEWEDESSETTTLMGDPESAWKNRLKVPPSSHSSSSSSSPAPGTAWGHPESFSPNQPSVQQPQPSYTTQQYGNYLHMRRSSSVPPMMGMMGHSLGYYQDVSFGEEGYQNFNVGGELRPPSPSPPGIPTIPISSTAAGGFAYPLPRQSFSRISFSQLEAPMDTSTDPFAQYGYYGQRMSISAEHRMLLGGRRASSAQGMRRSWGTCNSANQSWGAYWMPPTTSTAPLQTDDSPLPEVDTSLFEPGFNLNSFSMSAPAPTQQSPSPDLTTQVVSPLDPIHAPVPVAAPQPTYPPSVQVQEQIPNEAGIVDMSQASYGSSYPPMGHVDSGVLESHMGHSYQQYLSDGTIVDASYQHVPEYLHDVTSVPSGQVEGAFDAAAMEQHRMMMAAPC